MKLLNLISDIIYPPACPFCKELLPFGEHICTRCEAQVHKRDKALCPLCFERDCRCEEDFFPFSSAYIYEGYIRSLLHDFKFRKRRHYSSFLAEKMYSAMLADFPEASFDAVCFVPCDKKTQRRRGYNQSELLARELSARLSVPLERVLIKTAENKKQHTLGAADRRLNVQNAFSVAPGCELSGRTLLLCDDIKTTGSTLRACREILLSSGAKQVYAVVAAMTHPEENTLDKPVQNN